MPPKKTTKKGKKSRQDDVEERTRAAQEGVDVVEDRETADSGGDKSDAESTTSATGKQNLSRYDFLSEEEARLVDFFEAHDEFYNKGNSKYSNTQYKRKVLDEMAATLNCHASKIQGWFKNQRTQVGKLMNPTKKKSGMGMEVLTVRKKWQLSNFAYLRAYIVPRSYSHDTEPTEVPAGEPDSADGGDEVEQHPSSSASVVMSEGKKRKRPKTQMHEALMEFLERPRESDMISKQMKEPELGLNAERDAFFQWFGTRLSRVPEESWDRFSEEAHQMLRKYISPASTASTGPSAALGAPPQPVAGPSTQQQTVWQPVAGPSQQWTPPQWQQHQWMPPQWTQGWQQPTQQQQQQQQIPQPARSHSTPMRPTTSDLDTTVQTPGQGDAVMELSLPSILSASFTDLLKGADSGAAATRTDSINEASPD